MLIRTRQIEYFKNLISKEILILQENILYAGKNLLQISYDTILYLITTVHSIVQ